MMPSTKQILFEALSMTQRKWQIRPLSTGMGIGSLTTASHLRASADADSAPNFSASNFSASSFSAADEGPSSQNLPPFLESFKTEDLSIRRQAQSAYAPFSVATSIRQQPSVRFGTRFIRFCSGFGLDLIVAIFTALVVAWAAVLAWNAGAAGTLNILESAAVIKDFLLTVTPLFLGLGALFLTLCWRGLKLVIS
jgi:hypothetical protein